MLEIFPEETRLNENTFRLISYSLVSLMMGCGAITAGILISRLIPTWPLWAFTILTVVITLERLFTYRRFADYSLMFTERLLNFGVQWIVIILLVKLVVGLSHGWSAFLAEIPTWQYSFADFFFNDELIIGLIAMAAAWMASGAFARLLEELGLHEALVNLEAPVQGNDLPARERLMRLVFSTTTSLVIMTAIIRIDLRAVFSEGKVIIQSLPPLAGGGASTLLYFMLGLALLSQTQFVWLHTRWNLSHIPVSGNLARRWGLYSILFLLILAIVVALLPTSYSLGVLAILGRAIDFIFQIIFYVLQFLLSILFFLIGTLLNLLIRQPKEENPVSPPQLPDFTPEANAAQFAYPSWWGAAKTLFFWVSLAAIFIFALTQYLRQHQEILQALRKFAVWRAAVKVWNWIKSVLAGVRKTIAVAMEDRRERARERQAAREVGLRGGFLSLRRLDPRQKIYFFYLAMVRRGSETGLPRKLSQTPHEYASTLEDALPTVDEDIDSMTDAFNSARYSRQDIQAEDANLVKSYWNRIRQALRRKP
jgi:hypothetical protein